MAKRCENCKYFKEELSCWGHCFYFNRKDVNKDNCCQFWCPDGEKVKRESNTGEDLEYDK